MNHRKLERIFINKLVPFLVKYNCIKIANAKKIIACITKDIYKKFGISSPIIILNYCLIFFIDIY